MKFSLERKNVDLFRKAVTVVKSKNSDKWTIPLNQIAFELIKSKLKVRSIKNDFVFTIMMGEKVNQRNLLRAFYHALKRAGIDDFRFHVLRHTLPQG